MDKSLRPYLAELIGTFALVFIGAGTVITSYLAVGPATVAVGPTGGFYTSPGQPQPFLVGIALAQGFVLAVVLSATLNVSGGFLNPAVTLTLWVFKRLETRQLIGCVAAQVAGAVLAGLCLRLIFQPGLLEAARLGTPHLNSALFGQGLSLGAILTGIGVELLLTFIFTFAIFGTVLDPRAPRLAGLGVGLALAAVIFMGYAITGAAVNPARWFGPALWEATVHAGAFTDHAVYWIGPTLGALLAGGLYTALILPPDREKAARAASSSTGPVAVGVPPPVGKK